jgi:tRNA-dihydrouridine synthase
MCMIQIFSEFMIKVLYACRLAFRTLVRKYSCDLCYTPMIIAADFVRSIKARDSEFTTNQGM